MLNFKSKVRSKDHSVYCGEDTEHYHTYIIYIESVINVSYDNIALLVTKEVWESVNPGDEVEVTINKVVKPPKMNQHKSKNRKVAN